MGQSDVMAEQFRMPSGPMAPAVAASLNRRNHGLIQESITALDVRSGHRTLDVGFGGGLSLVLLATAAADGHVAGVDPSAEMVERARRLLAPPVSAGHMTLELGAAEALPLPDRSFDRVLTCQTVYFWDDLGRGLTELLRVLVPGGRVAVAMMPRALQEYFEFAELGYRVMSHEQLMAAMDESGFTAVMPWARKAGDSWVVTAHRPEADR